MNYRQIQKLSYEQLTYTQFLYTCAKNNRTPFRILMFDNSNDRTSLIVLSKNYEWWHSYKTHDFYKRRS